MVYNTTLLNCTAVLLQLTFLPLQGEVDGGLMLKEFTLLFDTIEEEPGLLGRNSVQKICPQHNPIFRIEIVLDHRVYLLSRA